MVGHADTLNNFISAWNQRDARPIHPVWMLAGPRGIGKATLAYKIAKMVYGNVGDFFIIDLDRNIDQNGKQKGTAGSERIIEEIQRQIDQYRKDNGI